MHIAFSPPDITEEEIAEVVDTLRSGWITTGPKTKLFEKKLAEYMVGHEIRTESLKTDLNLCVKLVIAGKRNNSSDTLSDDGCHSGTGNAHGRTSQQTEDHDRIQNDIGKSSA